MSSIRVRFAPSPSGSLHLGGARTALINALFARQQGGRFVLRIEDTDTERNIEGADVRIEADLNWLGIVPDEGPGAGGEFGPYHQSERASSHTAALERLLLSGAAYPCFCSPDRERDAEHRLTAGCPGDCRQLLAEERAALRATGAQPAYRFALDSQRTIDDLLRGTVSFDGAPAPDPVIVRADGRATFLFAGAVDDAEQRISHVIRGDDHLPNAWKQAQLLRALGAPVPQYAHLALIHGPDHTPLSKRHGHASIGTLREAGYHARAVVVALAHLGMHCPDIDAGSDPWPQLLANFEIGRLSAAPAIHDPQRLDHWSGAWWRATSEADLAAAIRSRAEFGRWFVQAETEPRWLIQLVGFLLESHDTLHAALASAEAYLVFDGHIPGATMEISDRTALAAWGERWPHDGLADGERLAELSREVQKATGLKGAALWNPLRVALTGRNEGPALARLAPAIDAAARGREPVMEISSCRDRIARALEPAH